MMFAEILAVAGRAARVEVEDNVSPCRHPLKFVIEDPAVSGVRPAMDVKDQRILFLRIKVGRLLNPSLNVLAIETLVVNLLRRGQVELRPELAVEVGNAGLCAVCRDGEEIADHDGRGDQGNDSAGVRSDGKIEYCLIAASDFGYGAGLRIHSDQGRASLLGDHVE